MQFGIKYGINNATGKPGRKMVFDILKRAQLAGIRILDTADAYGDAIDIIGDFHRYHDILFEINTKFHLDNGRAISEQLQESLSRLNIRSVRTYFFHRFSDIDSDPSAVDDLILLKKKKLIRFVGVSVYGNEEFETAIKNEYVDVIQIPYNLLDNNFHRGDLITLAASKGKEVQARSVFLQGLLFKTTDEFPDQLKPLSLYINEIREKINSYGLTMEEVALRWAVSNPLISYVLIGVDNVDQLDRNISVIGGELPPDVSELIDSIHVRETELLYPKNWR